MAVPTAGNSPFAGIYMNEQQSDEADYVSVAEEVHVYTELDLRKPDTSASRVTSSGRQLVQGRRLAALISVTILITLGICATAFVAYYFTVGGGAPSTVEGLSTAPTHTITPPTTEADSRSTTEADSRSTTEADSQPTTASSQPASCGERLHYYPEIATPSGWMMCYAMSTDSPDVATTQCGDLLIDLGQGTYPTQKELLDAGGNFGCFKTATGITGVNPTYACRDNYQQTTYIATCSSCNGMGVCIRLP